MTKASLSFRKNIICITLFCFTLLRSCSTRNPFSDLDFGSQSLNPVVTGFKITGNSAISYRYGYSVSTAGDIDNDGYDDIIISAPTKSWVYVIYGGEESTMSNWDFSSGAILNPLTTGFTIRGNAEADEFGASVDTAGDINNDGYDDIIIAAPKRNNEQGAAYVIYGGPKSSMSNIDLRSTTLDPTSTGFMITGGAVNDLLGTSVSTAGDINNDDYDDIIVGARYADAYKGIAYVIYGGPISTRSNIFLSTPLNPLTTGFMITGNSGIQFGLSVNKAGDLDNDGYDDVIIGSAVKQAAYVIYGGPKSTRSNIFLSTPLDPLTTGFMMIGNRAENEYFGYSANTAGDLNNDGYDDIIVGASGVSAQPGAAYVIYGAPRSSMSNWDFSSGQTLDPSTTGFMIRGNAGQDKFGMSVSTAGDINNDGYDDIIIAAPNRNTMQGAAYVIYGGAKSAMPNIDLGSATLDPTSTGFMITGGYVMSQFGLSVSTAGDINNDGFDDIIIGAHIEKNHGAAYVIYGEILCCPTLNDIASCPVNCKQCSSESVCTACKSPYLLYHSECLPSCPPATLAIATECEDCPDNCNKCSSTSVCTECKSSYLIYKSECFSSCPAATIATSITTCEDCSNHCKKCSSPSVCTECQDSYLMYQSECFASCPDATFANTATTCQDCSNYCKKCSSPSVCSECQDSYLMYQSECFDLCPDTTFANTATTCQDCPMNCNHCTSPSVCTECVSPFVLYESVCLPSCPKTMFNSNNVCKDCPSYCSSCTSEDSCEVCFQGFTLSNSLCVIPEPEPVPVLSSSDQEVQGKANQKLSDATRGISSAVCVGSTVAPFAVLVTKTVQNTRYLNLSVTSELSDVYETWETDLIPWQVPYAFTYEDNFRSSPPLFAQYDTDSPFLVNFWPTLVNIAGGLTIFLIFFVLQILLVKTKYERWTSLVQKLVAASFNFALVQAYACMDDILFYLVLDAKTNPLNSSFCWASLISAVAFFALGCLLVLFNFWTVKKYQNIKKLGAKEIEVFNEKNKYWELFYSDFNDNNFWSQSFFAILVIRSTLSSFIITVLYDHPLMQTLSLITMDIIIILFLYLKNPFNTLRGTLAQYYYEIITLLVHICTLSLSFQDISSQPSDTLKIVASTAIIYLNTALITGAVGFMFIEIYKTISEMKKAARLKKLQVVPEETQNLTQTAGPLQAPETDDRRRQDWTNPDQTASIENFYFLPGRNQNGHVMIYDLNMESSQIRESNSNVDNSKDQDMEPTNRTSQSATPMIFGRRQRGRRSVFPSQVINKG